MAGSFLRAHFILLERQEGHVMERTYYAPWQVAEWQPTLHYNRLLAIYPQCQRLCIYRFDRHDRENLYRGPNIEVVADLDRKDLLCIDRLFWVA
jgi:hypothetical protein